MKSNFRFHGRLRDFSVVALMLLLCAAALAEPAPQTQPAPPPAIEAGETPTGDNLMPNGDFEQAGEGEKKDSPKHWQRIEGLVWHWQADPTAPEHGKAIMIDTDVDQRQAYNWWVQRYLNGAPIDRAPKKTANPVPGYGTIAGLDGGYYWSDLIPIKPGRAYQVYVDAKGPASKVFVRGYEKEVPLFFGDEAPATVEMFRKARGQPELDAKGRPVRYRLRYRYSKWFSVGGSDEWKTYTHEKPIDPTGREITEDVRYIRVMLYPYWPQGQYWYDNIRVYEVDPLPDRGVPEAQKEDFEEMKVVK
ncbi:MAG: hypothetical protein IT444_07555 [Phycisphaeraceae bacterium]|nr:hypothetical protein [Phycisphaeraceae bacterium]